MRRVPSPPTVESDISPWSLSSCNTVFLCLILEGTNKGWYRSFLSFTCHCSCLSKRFLYTLGYMLKTFHTVKDLWKPTAFPNAHNVCLIAVVANFIVSVTLKLTRAVIFISASLPPSLALRLFTLFLSLSPSALSPLKSHFSSTS